MTSLYAWLLFAHLTSLAAFLLAHGVSAAAAFAVRGLGANSRPILAISFKSWYVAGPAFAVLLATGIWMGILGKVWGHGWIWVAIVILIGLMVGMNRMSVPFYQAREAKSDSDMAQHLARTRPEAMAWTAAVAMLAILFLMVFKPF